jgi:radical SAM superfamily enzyme YgiQ (UPF0313 family)
MKYGVQMGSSAKIYLQIFINVVSEILKLIRGDIQRHRQHGDRISLISKLGYKNDKRIEHVAVECIQLARDTAGSCEHSNEYSGSIRVKFLTIISRWTMY